MAKKRKKRTHTHFRASFSTIHKAMVRGDTSCPLFCTRCRYSCHCYTCGNCHNCKPRRGGFGTSFDCEAWQSHDCKVLISVMGRKTDHVTKESEGRDEKILNFPKLFNTPTIEISIGQSDPERRYVPKNALIEHSEYFKTLFSFEEKTQAEGHPPSGKSNTLALDTDVDRPEAFDCFIQFAYWNDYYASKTSEASFLDITLHAHVYVLAERLQAIPLKETAVRKATKLAMNFSNSVQSLPDSAKASVELECIPGVIEIIYINTVAGAPNSECFAVSSDAFRRLIASFSARCFSRLKPISAFEGCFRMFPDFAMDLLSQLQDGKELTTDDKGDLKWTG